MNSVGNAQLIPVGKNDLCINSNIDFRTGDFITGRVKALPFILHRGIIVVEDQCVYIYHNTPMYKNASGGNVVKENIEEWQKSRVITSIQPTNMSREYIEEMSMRFANRKFDLFSFNCEQYVFFLKEGKARSPQLLWWSIGIITFYSWKLGFIGS